MKTKLEIRKWDSEAGEYRLQDGKFDGVVGHNTAKPLPREYKLAENEKVDAVHVYLTLPVVVYISEVR